MKQNFNEKKIIIYFTECNNLGLNKTLIKTIWWQVGYSLISNILFSTAHELLKIVQMFHYRHILYYFDRIYLVLNTYCLAFLKKSTFFPMDFSVIFCNTETHSTSLPSQYDTQQRTSQVICQGKINTLNLLYSIIF